ncbi:lipoprotein [Bordetella pertussis]|nr:type II and III secretion system protein [Bordetella bronchiseptica MBORD849]CFO09456.1 lipoprotein [Bordetella pertussis]CPN56475.1 lipoprotein [Bordetella pertussis]
MPGLAVQQKRETVGTFLTLLPEARDDGRILLSISYDNTIAQPLRTLTFGEGGQQVSLQQIAIDGSGIVQQVELLPGQPVILSGFDHSEDQYERHRLFPDAPLAAGGHDRTARERVTTVVMVTAQIDEG